MSVRARVGRLGVAGVVILWTAFVWAAPARIVAKDAPVYMNADAKSPRLAVLPVGMLVESMQTEGDWHLIKFEDKDKVAKVGYVRGKDVELLGAPAKETEAAPAPVEDEPPEEQVPIPRTVRAEDGCYWMKTEKELLRIEAKTPNQTRTGSTVASAFTLGIKPARLNAILPGLAAEAQTTAAPSFYLHLAENEMIGEYYLVKFTVKQKKGHREIEVGSQSWYKAQGGLPEKDIFLLDTKRLASGIYRVTPKVALPAGEYGLLMVPQVTASGQSTLTPRKIFDFSVR